MAKQEADHQEQEHVDEPVADAMVNTPSQGDEPEADLDQGPVDEASNTDGEPQTQTVSDQEQIEQLRQELEQLNGRLLRVSADYQNFVRRTDQNLVDAREQQTFHMAKALVPVFDHFDRAVAVDSDKATVANLLEGVQIVRDELLRALQQFGIERLDVKTGEEFDPNRHEALMRQASDDVAVNHVVQQLQPGYLLAEKVLRGAQVIVAAEPSEQPAGEEQTPTEVSKGDDEDLNP